MFRLFDGLPLAVIPSLFRAFINLYQRYLKMKTMRFSFQTVLLIAIIFLEVACSSQTSNHPTISSTPFTTISKSNLIPISTPEPTVTSISDSSLSRQIGTPSSTLVSEETLTSVPTPQPLTLPQSPIVFYYHALDGHLYRTDIAGSFTEQLTTTPEVNPNNADIETGLNFYRPPQVSPNGRWLILNDGQGGWTLLDLLENQDSKTGTGQDLLSPTWSPDSQRFAFLSSNQLCIYELVDQVVSCPVQLENLKGAVWSPNETHIAVITTTPATTTYVSGQVWLVDLANHTVESIGIFSTSFEATINDIVTWLPNGTEVLIKTTGEVPSALFSLDNNMSTVFSESIIDASPDGKYFLHASSHVSTSDELIGYDLPNTYVCDDSQHEFIIDWAWSNDSQNLAYTLLCRNVNEIDSKHIVVVNIETQTLLWHQKISPDLQLKAWTPDNKYLLLNTTGGWPQDASIWRFAANGFGLPEKIKESSFLLEIIPQWQDVYR